jgi:osmotically inducible lipoprotein OsmB
VYYRRKEANRQENTPMRKSTKLIAILFASTLGLAGCVASDLERAGAGAVIGGVTAAALNGNVATGVAVGAAGGALCDDINLC